MDLHKAADKNALTVAFKYCITALKQCYQLFSCFHPFLLSSSFWFFWPRGNQQCYRHHKQNRSMPITQHLLFAMFSKIHTSLSPPHMNLISLLPPQFSLPGYSFTKLSCFPAVIKTKTLRSVLPRGAIAYSGETYLLTIYTVQSSSTFTSHKLLSVAQSFTFSIFRHSRRA